MYTPFDTWPLPAFFTSDVSCSSKPNMIKSLNNYSVRCWVTNLLQNGDTLKLRLIHKDAANIPRNHIRQDCFATKNQNENSRLLPFLYHFTFTVQSSAKVFFLGCMTRLWAQGWLTQHRKHTLGDLCICPSLLLYFVCPSGTCAGRRTSWRATTSSRAPWASASRHASD